MHWGTSLWYFFHTYAEKVNEKFFENNRKQIIEHFTSCLLILPCPMCQVHAKNNLKKFNVIKIYTKNDFKEFLLAFHNEVNKILKKPVFTLTELNNKYPKANFNKIIVNANENFTKNLHLSRNLNDSMLRKITFIKILKFIDNNKTNFIW